MLLFLAYLLLLISLVARFARASLWRRTFYWSLVAVAYIFTVRLFTAVIIGTPSVGTTLFTLPEVQLPSWLTGIRLGGVVTRERITSTIEDTYLIAAVIATFGAMTAFLSPKRILSLVPKRARSFSTALVIALNSYPQLVHAISRIKRAQELRSPNMARWSKMGVAIIEDAVKRSLLIGQSLFLRGYDDFYKSVRRSNLNTPSHLTLVDFTVSFSPELQPVLDKVSIDIAPGSLTLIAGDTGSGKSTLLKVLAGLVPATTGGYISQEIPHLQRAVYLPQNPRDSFLTETVFEEIAFALKIRHEDELSISEKVAAIANRIGIAHLLERDLTQLSGGETQRVAIASLMVSQPQYLLLDEPASELDSEGRSQLLSLISELTHYGVAIVIAEHRSQAFTPLRPDIYLLKSGALTRATHLPENSLPNTDSDRIACIIGPNGSGKTRYLNSLIGADKPGYLPQNPGDLFFGKSLGDECLENDRDWNLSLGSTFSYLQKFGAFDQAAHPADLSEGQRLLLAFSLIAARKPDRILLDEPTRGLDFEMQRNLLQQIHTLSANCNITIATHDLEFAHALTSKVLEVSHVAK